MTFLKYTSTDKTQRDTAHNVEQNAQKFYNEVMSRNDIYKVLVNLEPDIDTFGIEEKTLLMMILEDFRHRGSS